MVQRRLGPHVENRDESDSAVQPPPGIGGEFGQNRVDRFKQKIKKDFSGMIEGIDTSVGIVLIETMFDIREALAALDVVKRSLSALVIVTLTYDRNPRGFFTVMGNEVRDSVRVIENAGADVVGANCTLASGDMTDLARVLRESTDLPILCQPNAGQPTVRDGMPAYDQTPAEFADDVTQMFDIGINAVGGCCGTTPAFIREVSTVCRFEI